MDVPDHRDQRTLPPTPKRVEEFRKRGEVALSKDLTTVAGLTGGVWVAAIYSRQSLASIFDLCRRAFQAGPERVSELVPHAASTFALACAPALAGTLAATTLAGVVQLGWPPALKRPQFNLAAVFSLQGLSQLASPKAAVARALKSTAKVGFVAIACMLAIAAERTHGLDEGSLTGAGLGAHLVGAIVRLCLFAGGALLGLAALDYGLSRRTLLARMRMTPSEFKREHREQEGDPHVKRRRRQQMRELSKRRLKTAVQGADVVLVNPTEYAVALRYHSTEDRAPRVVAKGRGAVAERIREFARSFGVPIIAEPPLTRLIHKVVPEGKEIPSSLYHAVAEVLAYVYRLRQRRSV